MSWPWNQLCILFIIVWSASIISHFLSRWFIFYKAVNWIVTVRIRWFKSYFVSSWRWPHTIGRCCGLNSFLFMLVRARPGIIFIIVKLCVIIKFASKRRFRSTSTKPIFDIVLSGSRSFRASWKSLACTYFIARRFLFLVVWLVVRSWSWHTHLWLTSILIAWKFVSHYIWWTLF